MQLTVRDVSRLLGVPEAKVYRWLDDGQIPACRVQEEVRFNRAEVLEWATLRKLPLSAEVLRESDGGSLSSALAAGGVRRAGGADEAAVLRAVAGALPLPEEERATLLEVLLARGSGALTPVGEGVAMPHVRAPAVAAVEDPLVALFYLDTPLAVASPDGRPVDVVFFVLSPTVRSHLHVLSRLAAALHDEGFRAALRRRAPAEAVLAELRRLEGRG